VDGRAITDPRRWGAIPRRVLGMAAENVTPRRASGQAENVPPQRAGGQAESDRAGWLMPRPHLG